MSSVTLEARAQDLGRQLRDLLKEAPVGQTIQLPAIGVTIEVRSIDAETVRLGVVASGDVILHRATLPDYSGIPEIDVEEFARQARERPFVPTQAMLDEDWSHLIPKSNG